ncbi:hypothetical protein CTAYLR_008612 [Chrysophaeum taylorii]|uniref:Protein kinase domain-containing protein n=1 Tax=Chrysophaeum taylorii TaxID=2483200 RepID=A0AAD7XP28_9STRA|nr:hypothetical protein CTAYLR_008612 [Chrysophaeum taylorii]
MAFVLAAAGFADIVEAVLGLQRHLELYMNNNDDAERLVWKLGCLQRELQKVFAPPELAGLFTAPDRRQMLQMIQEAERLVKEYVRLSFRAALRRLVMPRRHGALLKRASNRVEDIHAVVLLRVGIANITPDEWDKRDETDVPADMRIPESALNFQPPYGDVLGEGAFGTVTKAGYQGTTVAVKTLNPDQADFSEFLNEAKVMWGVACPRVVKLYGCVRTAASLLLVMAYMEGGSLYDRYNKAVRDPQGASLRSFQTHAVKFVADVASGMRFIYEHQVQHRDLKSMNVLLDRDDRACIADFGLAKGVRVGGDPDDVHRGVSPDAHKTLRLEMTTLAGSLCWMAPELRAATPGQPVVFSEYCDVYSFGIVVYEVLGCELPNRPDGGRHTPPRPPVPRGATGRAARALANLVTACCKTRPRDRPRFASVCDRIEQFQDGSGPEIIARAADKPAIQEDVVLEDMDYQETPSHDDPRFANININNDNDNNNNNNNNGDEVEMEEDDVPSEDLRNWLKRVVHKLGLAYECNANFRIGNHVKLTGPVDATISRFGGRRLRGLVGQAGTVEAVFEEGVLIKLENSGGRWVVSQDALAVLHERARCADTGQEPLEGMRYKKIGSSTSLCRAAFDRLPQGQRRDYIAIARPNSVCGSENVCLEESARARVIADRPRLCHVEHLETEGDVVVVKMDDDDTKLAMAPERLAPAFVAGSKVRLTDDVDLTRNKQDATHGGFYEGMVKYCGKTGKVMSVQPNNGSVYVEFDFNGQSKRLHPDLLDLLELAPARPNVPLVPPGEDGAAERSAAPAPSPSVESTTTSSNQSEPHVYPPYGKPEIEGGRPRRYSVNDELAAMLHFEDMGAYLVCDIATHIVALDPKPKVVFLVDKFEKKGYLIGQAVDQMFRGERDLDVLSSLQPSHSTRVMIEQILLTVQDMEAAGAVANPGPKHRKLVNRYRDFLGKVADVVASGPQDPRWATVLESSVNDLERHDIHLQPPFTELREGERDARKLTRTCDVYDTCLVVELLDQLASKQQQPRRRPEPPRASGGFTFPRGAVESLAEAQTDRSRDELARNSSLWLGKLPALVRVGPHGMNKEWEMFWRAGADELSRKGWDVGDAVRAMRFGERDPTKLTQWKDNDECAIIRHILACVEELEAAGRFFNDDQSTRDFLERNDENLRMLVDALVNKEADQKFWGTFREGWLKPKSRTSGWHLEDAITKLWKGERDVVALANECNFREGRVVESVLADFRARSPAPPPPPNDDDGDVERVPASATFFFTDGRGWTSDPLSYEELESRVRSGGIQAKTLVYAQGVTNGWQRLRDVPLLGALAASTPREGRAVATARVTAFQHSRDDNIDAVNIDANHSRAKSSPGVPARTHFTELAATTAVHRRSMESELAQEVVAMLKNLNMRATDASVVNGMERHSTVESVVAYVLDNGGAVPND